jgi:hypothetical protein
VLWCGWQVISAGLLLKVKIFKLFLIINYKNFCLLSKNVKIKIYKSIILPVVLCGCETCYLALREEHRLGVLENKVLRSIFGHNKDEIIGVA